LHGYADVLLAEVDGVDCYGVDANGELIRRERGKGVVFVDLEVTGGFGGEDGCFVSGARST
jgi:hypothetical protein